MILLSTVINTFEDKFLARYNRTILPSHRKALQVMKNCRTEASPHMLAQCTDHDCRQYSFIPHSCGHRNCPHCQSHEGQQWIHNQLGKQLPAEYYLITFTLPYQLRDLAWRNQKLVYALFFFCVQNVLKTFTKNDKKLKGMAGFTAILHTHSRELNFHPHIHVVIPGGSINKKSRLWRVKSGKYLFNQKALAKVFRAKLLKEMVDNKLQVPKSCPEKWVVDCKNVGNGDKALIYLGRYLYKGVIQEKDILKCENGQVTFRYTESKTKTVQIKSLKGEDFLWLLMQHVLPKGFRKVRSYGFLHPCSKKIIQLLQLILNFNPVQMYKKIRKKAGIICKCCGAKMIILRTMIPRTEARRLALRNILTGGGYVM